MSKISAPISNKVKVMISADGVADYPKLIEIDKNTTLHGKLPTNIEKPGYKFKGFTKTMGNAADFDDNEVIKEDIRLYAVFEQTAAPTKKVTGIESVTILRAVGLSASGSAGTALYPVLKRNFS